MVNTKNIHPWSGCEVHQIREIFSNNVVLKAFSTYSLGYHVFSGLVFRGGSSLYNNMVLNSKIILLPLLTLIYYDITIWKKLHRRYDNWQYYMSYKDLRLTASHEPSYEDHVWPSLLALCWRSLVPFFCSPYNCLINRFSSRIETWTWWCRSIKESLVKPLD